MDITNKIKVDKGNVTDDTIADIEKTQDNLTSYIKEMLSVDYLVRYCYILDNSLFFICLQVDQENTMAVQLINKIQLTEGDITLAIEAVQTNIE